MRLGVIAPTAEGYFDLVINFAQVDVSFDYTITIAVSDKNETNEKSVVPDLIATGYTVDSGSLVPFVSDQIITGHVDYENDISMSVTQRTIRVFVKWDDGPSAIMNNKTDTLTTIGSDKFGILDVTIEFIQTPSVTPPEPEPEPEP